MKTSDSDRKVNRNIYPDAVNVIRSVVTSRGAKGGSAPLAKIVAHFGGSASLTNCCINLAFQSALTLLPIFCMVLL